MANVLFFIYREAFIMSKIIYGRITISIITVFIFSLFLTSANFSYAGINELKENVNKLEISNDNAAAAGDNQSQAAPAEGAANQQQQNANGAEAMTATAESVKSGVESIKTGFKGIFEGLKDIFKGLFDVFKELVNSFKQLFSSIEGDVKKAGEEIGSGVQQLGNQIQNGAQEAADAVGKAAEEGANAVNEAVNGAEQGAGVEIPNNSEGQNQPAANDSAAPAAEGQSGSSAPASQSGTVIDEDPNGLNVRTSPWGEIIGTLQKGAKIEIIGQEGDWYKIKIDGKEAYVYSSLVSADSPAAQQQNADASASSGQAGATSNANADSSTQTSTDNASGDTPKTEPAAPEKPAQENANAETPYFNQYDNEFFSASTCQNTSLAMVLAKYGWKGNPDQITKGYGKDMAQTPGGLEYVFNAIAEQEGMKVRIKSHTAGTMEMINKLLAEGKPVIAHGWFTKSGHVVTITGFDGQNYTVNDPAGKWNEQFKGGYSSESGKGVKYSKEALTEALVENGEVWCHEIINTDDKVAGL